MPEATTQSEPFAEFAARFRESAKGNLWTRYKRQTLSVFRDWDGDGFRWSIAGGGHRLRYSPDRYDTELEALKALAVTVSAVK